MDQDSKFTVSPEAQEQLQEALRKMIEAMGQVFDALVSIVQEVMEKIRKIAEQLARFFLKMQLLEWRVPYRLADFIASKVCWYWAWKIGWRWFNGRVQFLE